MTVTPTAAVAVDLSQAAQAPTATQSLFEHMAAQAKGLPVGASPAELSTQLLQSMDGFLDRVRTYGTEATGGVVQPEGAAKAGAGEDEMQRLIDSLGKTFDYSTEVAMVVRNTSGVSSSVNTLLRGQ
jgi:hypothetical protein